MTDVEFNGNIRYKDGGCYLKGYFELFMPKHVANRIKQQHSDTNERVLDNFNIKQQYPRGTATICFWRRHTRYTTQT